MVAKRKKCIDRMADVADWLVRGDDVTCPSREKHPPRGPTHTAARAPLSARHHVPSSTLAPIATTAGGFGSLLLRTTSTSSARRPISATSAHLRLTPSPAPAFFASSLSFRASVGESSSGPSGRAFASIELHDASSQRRGGEVGRRGGRSHASSVLCQAGSAFGALAELKGKLPEAKRESSARGGDAAMPSVDPTTRVVLWFRNDLRLSDNYIVKQAENIAARTRGCDVLPVFCFDPRFFAPSAWGSPKTGGHRARFQLECVLNLKQNLRAIGSDLVVEVGKPEEIIPKYLLAGAGKTNLVLTQVRSRRQHSLMLFPAPPRCSGLPDGQPALLA